MGFIEGNQHLYVWNGRRKMYFISIETGHIIYDLSELFLYDFITVRFIEVIKENIIFY